MEAAETFQDRIDRVLLEAQRRAQDSNHLVNAINPIGNSDRKYAEASDRSKWSGAGEGVGMLRGREILGLLVSWFLDVMLSWFRSFEVSWFLGFNVSWFLSFEVSWF